MKQATPLKKPTAQITTADLKKKINALTTLCNEQTDELRLIKSHLRINKSFGKKRR